MAHAYGDGFYGLGTYGSFDGAYQATRLGVQGRSVALEARGAEPKWQLAAAGLALTVQALGTSLRVLADRPAPAATTVSTWTLTR